MKFKNIALLVIGIGFFGKTNAQKLKTSEDSLAYAMAVTDVIELTKKRGLSTEDFNVKLYLETLKKLLDGKIKVNEGPIKQSASQNLTSQIIQEKMQQIAEKNAAEATAFHEKLKKDPTVTTLPSGLQYKIITAGTGAIPTANNKVNVHYSGALIDGTIFDSSIDRGEPISFPVTGVIKGWVEALQLMPVGSTWMLYIPYDLAYGERGIPNSIIGPKATLVFEVQLIGIE